MAIHLTLFIQSSAGIPIHKIPNVALGKVERRHITRIFFPRLYEKGKCPAISAEILATIYDECLRPAILNVNPFDQSRWPITYSKAMDLYRDSKGMLHFGTLDVPANMLESFGKTLLGLLRKHEGLADAFFVHEIRGTKGASHHDPSSIEMRRAALDEIFDSFDRQLLKIEEWVVDIAMEVRHEGHVLQWLTKGHRRILEFLLPSASENKISDILHSKTQYNCDISAQLSDLGGFRALPGSRGKADGVIYINNYTTDKSATYQLHQGVFRRRKPWHMFPTRIDQLLTDLKVIGETFRICGGSPGAGLEGNAHMEIHTPLSLADQKLLNVLDALIKQTLLSFECATFW